MMNINQWKRLVLLLIGISAVIAVIYLLTHPSEKNRHYSQRGPFAGYKSCNPEQNVVFHKTHKCSSSTIQNIMLRFGLKHNLNVVLPLSGNYLGKMMPFSGSMLKGTPWQQAGLEYNLFCLHNRWNGAQVQEVMGVDPYPIYFTILRDPIELFKSLWDYLDMSKLYNNISLEEYSLSDKQGPLADRRHIKHMGRNQMLWDFGLNPQQFDNKSAIEAKIVEIEQTFELVLITEEFDQSMVLLKNLLCWDYRDVTSLKLNARKASSKSQLSSKAKSELKRWLWGDYVLYNHFRAKFEQKVDTFGRQRMQHEMEILRHANDQMKQTCAPRTVDNQELPPEQRLNGKGVMTFKVDESLPDCKFMAMKETAFLDYMRTLQTERAEKCCGKLLNRYNPKLYQELRYESLDKLKDMFPNFKGPN